MKNNKPWWILSFSISFFGIVLPMLLSLLVVKNRQDSLQPIQDIFVALSEKEITEQAFTARNDNINIILLNFKNPNFDDKNDYLFSLKSSEGQTLAEIAFSGRNIGDPSTLRFQFDPIASSKNKQFIFSIKNISSNKSGISIASSRKSGLNYALYYRTINKKSAAVDLIRQFVKNLSSDPLFLIFWLTLIFLTVWAKIKFSERQL